MAVKTKEEVVQEIVAHIDKTGGDHFLWFIGIANSNPKALLFDTHKVSSENGKWIYRTMETNQEANEVVKALIGLGLKNVSTINSFDGKIVYAYKKTDTTSP